MREVKKIRSACEDCQRDCGAIVHVKDGKVRKVREIPILLSATALCETRGLPVMQKAYHWDRILYPMNKGNGK
jgi:anaerobic selenocysteine-containing dehydrogenase